MTPPSISVIICAYALERWGQLVAAVDSVLQQRPQPCELIVVVDHNPQLLACVSQELTAVMAVANTDVRGLSGARNSGVAAARGGIVAFLDDDAVAAPGWLRWLQHGYADPDVAGLGGAVVPVWTTTRPAWFPEEFDWVVGCTYRGMPVTRSPIRNPIGANMSFRRDLFQVVGGFRCGIGRVGTIPVGCEETEWCIRVRQHLPEAVFIYEPRARVEHRVPHERTTWTYFWRRCFAEGRSKSLVALHVGRSDGLATERRYTLRTLPAGVGRGFLATAKDGDFAGVARGGAIIAGLAITTTGYLTGRVTARSTGGVSRARKRPAAVLDRRRSRQADPAPVADRTRIVP